ncbi:MAG TPA: ABC transporter substrate-binding protein [Candidatus Limnocylindria bacterium]|nr:ABC transporter substrate-binding protein [Candidatus Limnocylindria bacterium]
MPRPLRTATLVGVLVLILGGCGKAAEAPSSPTVGRPELAELTIGVLPIADVAPIYLAIDRGLFANEGLEVTVELVQGGAAAIPALVAGDLDIAYGNWVSFLLANQADVDLRAVAAGVAAAPGFTELLALPESGLEGNPAGLAGTTVAVNTLANIGELAIRSTLRDAGLEPDAVQLIEFPFPEMAAALERGDADVIWASEPVPTVVKRDLEAVVVTDSFVGEMDAFPVAGYQATEEFVNANPNTVAAFRRALASAVALIRDEPDALTDTLLAYTGLPREVVEELSLPSYEAGLDAATLERVRDYLVEFGLLEEGLDVSGLVAAGSRSE